jgi:hypothetical protein
LFANFNRKNIEGKLNRVASTLTTAHAIIIILLVSFAVYSKALFSGFVYDDTYQILENRWITDIRFIPEIFTASVWSFKSDIGVSN